MKTITAILVAAVLLGALVLADDATVDVRVTVIDSSDSAGSGLEGAYVELEGTDYSGSSDADGVVLLSGVPPGTYQIHASADGFQDGTLEAPIASGNSDFRLELQPSE